MDYKKALDFLSQYTNYERELRYPYDGWSMNLDRVRVMLDAMGAPDKGLRVVHIAGSKGKGSVAAMIESMARAEGFSTGLFTSPHLVDFRERIRLSGEMISEDKVAALVERLIPAADKVKEQPKLGPVTYFEILTTLAFAAFADAKVDLAVVEAGLGGRFDATTVCDPAVSVITPISLDHTDILGDTIPKIAVEKSFIIKPGRPAAIAPQPEDALAVFEARAKEVGASIELVNERYSWRSLSQEVDGQQASLSGARDLDDVLIPLAGEHQLINAATALTALDLLGDSGVVVSDEAAILGLSNLSWPARFQRIRENPDLILDGAHNAASAACLRDTLAAVCPGKKIIAVIGLGGDKDAEGFARELGPALDTVFITRSRAMKAVEPERLKDALGPFNVEAVETGSVGEAMEAALSKASPDDVVLVTGSFYVISEVMEWDSR